jgi:branched-chain amino acid transport system substrate-binding protein
MKSKLTLVVVSLALLAGISCSRNSGDSNEIVIGEFGSLTGTTATFGTSTKNGVDLAIDEINKAGGVLGKQIRIVVEDDQGKPEEAQTVVTKLITSDKVVAILGEVASSRTLAAAPVAQQNKIPLVTPSSTNPKVTQIGDYIFRTCFIDPFQGLVMAKFATNTLKAKRVAILRDIKNDYSVGLADVFVENFKKMGGAIVADQSYSEGDTDFSAQLTAMKDTKPEAIFVPGYYTEVGLIARQARKLGLTMPLLGGDGWDSPKLWEIGGEALNGTYYSNHTSMDDPNPVIQKFVSDYKARFGEAPDSLGANAYDSAKIMVDAIKRAGSTDPAKLRDALAQTKNFPGLAGPITIDENRNAVKPAVILKVQDGKLEFVERVMP